MLFVVLVIQIRHETTFTFLLIFSLILDLFYSYEMIGHLCAKYKERLKGSNLQPSGC